MIFVEHERGCHMDYIDVILGKSTAMPGSIGGSPSRINMAREVPSQLRSEATSGAHILLE
jgi:hypothetical protein